MTRTDITYPEQPEFIAPRLLVGDTVFIYVTDDQPHQWMQSKVIAADLWNGVWEYQAIVESTLSNEFDAEYTIIDVLQTFLFKETDIEVQQFMKQTQDFQVPLTRQSVCVLVKKYC